MLSDASQAISAGASGLVVGMLTAEGDVDEKRLREFMKTAGSIPVTFHRAFDMGANPHKNLETIISCGCQRLLSSGLQESALEGAPLLRELIQQAAGRIIIVPGGGVRPGNIIRIQRETGASEFHASARGTVPSEMVRAVRDLINVNMSVVYRGGCRSPLCLGHIYSLADLVILASSTRVPYTWEVDSLLQSMPRK
jgi:copper homeostasis protein